MNIKILHLREGAKQAEGLTVVIDVCRAFSVAAYAFGGGAKSITPVSTTDEAFEIKKINPDAILIGEVKGKKIEGFDFGNSPTEIANATLKDKDIVQRTSAGTQGIVNATLASEILSGGFVNAGAIVRYINKAQSEQVSLVCMGWEAREECVEDTLCAEYLRDSLEGSPTDFLSIKKQIYESRTGENFRNPEKPWFPETDLEHCTDLNKFDFILRCGPITEERPVFEKIDI